MLRPLYPQDIHEAVRWVYPTGGLLLVQQSNYGSPSVHPAAWSLHKTGLQSTKLFTAVQSSSDHARARAQCPEQRHCLTAQVLSALKTSNVTDGAAASQKVRESRPTAILARNCEYCAFGQQLHQRYSTIEFVLTETNLNLHGA